MAAASDPRDIAFLQGAAWLAQRLIGGDFQTIAELRNLQKDLDTPVPLGYQRTSTELDLHAD